MQPTVMSLSSMNMCSCAAHGAVSISAFFLHTLSPTISKQDSAQSVSDKSSSGQAFKKSSKNGLQQTSRISACLFISIRIVFWMEAHL